MATGVIETQPSELKTDHFKLPAYSPPFPVNINPLFSRPAFDDKAQRWLQHLKIDKVLSPKLYKMLIDMNVAELAALMYADAEEWGLEWASKFLFMLWIWDDTMDATDVGQSPEAALDSLIGIHMVMMWTFPDDHILRTRLEEVISYLEGQEFEEKTRHIESVLAEARSKSGTVYSKETSHVCNVYLELWKDAVARATPEFCLRMAHYVQDWVLGSLKEAEIRKRGTVFASVDECVKLRKTSSAVVPAIMILDLVYGFPTPNSWFYLPEMQRVLDATNDVVGWHNDIWSFKREVLVAKDKFNIVLTISDERKISYTEAVDITMQMIYSRIAELQQAISDLDAVTPPERRRSSHLYVETCKNVVSGTHYWHSRSVRYG